MTDGQNHYSSTRVKRSLLHFAIGKVGSGLAGLALLVLVVRVLPKGDYGTYVTYMALFEIIQLVSNFGLFPIAQRYVTDCRINGTQKQLIHLVSWACLGRFVSLLLVCGGLYIFSEPLLDFVGIPGTKSSFNVYLLIMLTEGVSRYLDMIFESLLLQGLGQASIFFRNISKLCAFATMMWYSGGLNLDTLVWLETMTATAGLGLSLLFLVKYLWSHRTMEQTQAKQKRYAPSGRLKFSLQFYLAQVISQIYGGDAIKLIVTRLFGVMTAASFGFAYSISMILQRYLPTYLLLGMVRPLFVAKISGGSDFSEIIRMANLLFKLNTFCLAPVVIFFILYGTQFSLLVSGGKYPDAGGLLIFLCLLLIIQTLHVILGLMTNATGQASSTLLGTIAGVIGVVVGVVLAINYGIFGLVAGLILSEILWCTVAWLILSYFGFSFRLDWLGLFKPIFVSICTVALFECVPVHADKFIDLLLMGGAVLLCYIILSYIIKPFRRHERETINRFLPKPIFVW